MRISYVLSYPELGGGTKVVFQHAGLLRGLGHEAVVLGEGPRPAWVEPAVPYADLTAGPPALPPQDLVIATYWTTLAVARRLDLGPVAHFCQGYEGGLTHLRPVLPEIEQAYAQPLPALVVSPHLGDLLRERFGRESALAPPTLDPLFRPAPWRLRPRRRPWIVVPGIFEAEVKGVPTALEAVCLLREAGVPCRVLRFALLPLAEEERRLLPPDRYLCAAPPAEVARAVQGADLLLFPSRPEEGFGLPLLEALAARVPAVATRIPSVEHLTAGTVPLVPVGDAAAMAEAARELLVNPGLWRGVRRAASWAARRFRPEAVAPALDRAVRWAQERALAGSGGEPD